MESSKIEWKWTKGEQYQRSRRRQLNNDTNNSNTNMQPNLDAEDEKFNAELEKSAYTSSLNYDENTWDILNQSLYNNGFRVSNKRENLDMKMADREMVQQIGFNPFLNTTNYLDDIVASDAFLKPINTTQDRIKNGTNDE
jgi:hypothetical protein